jgi:hypothetical protein
MLRWDTNFSDVSPATLPPIQLVLSALTMEIKRLEVKLTTHLRLVPKIRMHGDIPPLPNTSSLRDATLSIGKILQFFTFYIENTFGTGKS